MKPKKLLVAPLFLALSLSLASCSVGEGSSDSGLAGVAQSEDMASRGGGTTSKTVTGYEAAPAQTDKPGETPAQTQKYVIKTANLSVRVEDIEKKLDEARKIISAHKGEVSYSTSRIKDREMTASNYGGFPNQDRSIMPPEYPYPDYAVGDYALLNLEVPADNLEPLLLDLRKMGKVVVDSTSAQDATLEVLGLDAQIQSVSKSLEGLEKLLATAKNVDETLRVEQAITQRRGELASLQAQQNSLKQQAAKSSVSLQLVTDKAVKLTPGEKNWFQTTWDKISSASSDVVALLILGLLFFAPVIALVLLAVKFARRFLRPSTPERERTTDVPAEKPTPPVKETEVLTEERHSE